MGMNTSAMGSISATINGQAKVLEHGTEEEKWCKAQHLANNTFEDGEGADNGQSLFTTSPGGAAGSGDGGRECFIEDEDVRVVVVRIREGRIADWKGRVRDWVLRMPGEEDTGPMVNGL